MRTSFTAEQVADPDVAASESVIRKCVHCGFCLATCPTYGLLGDELDSPRGRIYLMKEMLESNAAPSPETVKHVDRCLSCLSCVSTCPSGVNYMHLVDHARAYIEENYSRRFPDALLRSFLSLLLPYPRRFRAALKLARMARPIRPLLDRWSGTRPLASMLALAPARLPKRAVARRVSAPARKRGRVILLQGCAEPVLKPNYREAAIRLLVRSGYEVVLAGGEGCCGALSHHMGRKAEGLRAARRNVDAWMAELADHSVDAILVTASGCGTMLKDYGYLLRNEPEYQEKSRLISERVRDVSEFLADIELPPATFAEPLTVAYHPACSLQHGQKVLDTPRRLLAAAGFTVNMPKDHHICCGSAGVYNILQPEMANQLGDRKVEALDKLGADVIASGNVGCATQIGMRTATPVVHTIELLDWATGGPRPAELTPRQLQGAPQ